MSGNLVAKINFLNNTKNGLAINYYTNGTKNDEVSFSLGKENGIHIVYDSTGMISYKDYYYYGRQMGPSHFYDNSGNIKEYYFVDFEGDRLFYSEYDTSSIRHTHEYFHMSALNAISDGAKKINLFLYNIQPPKFSFEYKIYKKEVDKTLTIIDSVSHDLIFYQKVLPELPRGSNYCLALNTYDSIKNEKKIFFKEILIGD